jgi:RNA polymerase sigma factor (sigma-70 family)
MMWCVPPNWSSRDWHEEMKAEILAAAWEAERDFDPARNVPFQAFLDQRVLSRALKRYRREWSFARHCGLHLQHDHSDDAAADGLQSEEVTESLQSYLRGLPEVDRRLIEGLYWEDKTEIEVARTLSVSQQAISKRKRRILDKLRHRMSEPEKSDFIAKSG